MLPMVESGKEIHLERDERRSQVLIGLDVSRVELLSGSMKGDYPEQNIQWLTLDTWFCRRNTLLPIWKTQA